MTGLKNHPPVDKSSKKHALSLRHAALKLSVQFFSGREKTAGDVIEAAKDFLNFLSGEIEIAVIELPVNPALRLANLLTEAGVSKDRLDAPEIERVAAFCAARIPPADEGGGSVPDSVEPDPVEILPERLRLRVQAGDRGRFLRALQAAGPEGLTAPALAAATGVQDNSARTIICNLVKAGQVVRKTERRYSAAHGRNLALYVAAEHAPPDSGDQGARKSRDQAPAEFKVKTPPSPEAGPVGIPVGSPVESLIDGLGRVKPGAGAAILKVLLVRHCGRPKVSTDIAALKRECSLTDGKVRAIVAGLEKAGFVERRESWIVPLKNLNGESLEFLKESGP